MSTKVICVVNNSEIFNSVVKNNGSLSNCEIFSYDNTNENISITKHYNNFIKENVIDSQDDFWCLFIHQDFGFMEKVDNFLDKLDKKAIYGAIGAKLFKNTALKKLGLLDKVKLKGNGELKLQFGQILQGNNDYNFEKYGLPVFTQMIVDAVDCCCVILHSSLIKKYNLMFDENLTFHLYAEELCFRAKNDFKIKSKVIQTKCFHMGKGNIDDEFYNSLAYLQNKFDTQRIPSTCPT